MPAQSAIFDAMVLHRIDVERFTRGQVEDALRQLGEADAALVAMLRERLQHLKAGEIRSARATALLAAVVALRLAQLREVGAAVRPAAVELAKLEARTMERIVVRRVGVEIAIERVEASTIRDLIAEPLVSGHGAARTLGQWLDDIIRADRHRILGALQHGIHTVEDVDAIVRRLTGTRQAKYADGILAVTRRHMEGYVRTSMNRAANAAVIAWGEANANLVIGFEWTAILDGNACIYCLAENGKVRPVGGHAPPAGMKATTARIPLHPRDRCSWVPIFDKVALAEAVAIAEERLAA